MVFGWKLLSPHVLFIDPQESVSTILKTLVIEYTESRRKGKIENTVYYEVKAGVEEISASKMVALNQQGNWTKWGK